MTERYQLYEGDCITAMRSFAPNTFDTLITDPPAGVAFMGKTWDHHSRYEPQTPKGQSTLDALTLLQLEPWAAGFVAFTVDWAVEALRCLKPGAMGLVWALPRTSDLTGLGLRLAGFEVKENLYHFFGSGFPKGHRVGEAVRRSLGEGAYCECDANRHSSASTYPSQHKDAHTRNLGLSFDDDPQQPNAQHSSHTPLDYQGDYQPDSDSCDALAHQVQADDLAFPQQQGCAQEHNHSGVPWGDQGGESSHSPCQAQYNGHLSNRDSAHPLTYANGESFDTPQNKSGLANNSIQTDNEAQGFHKQYNSLQPLPYDMPPDQNYNTGLPCCQKCGKPIAHIWDGYNVALKPAVEEWLLIMKPLDGTYAANALAHGVAGLNIDGCRIGAEQSYMDKGIRLPSNKAQTIYGQAKGQDEDWHKFPGNPAGRWPANLVLDEWYERVMRLKSDLSDEVKEIIGEYFYGDGSVRTMQTRLSDFPQQANARTGEVLQESLLPSMVKREHTGRQSPDEGKETQPRIKAKDGGKQAGYEQGEIPSMEGRDLQEQGLHDDSGRSVADGRTRDVQIDVHIEQRELCAGTSLDNGSAPGTAIGETRNSTSPERAEERQPDREFGDTRQRISHPGTLEAQETSKRTKTGNRRTKARDFTIEESLIPPQWVKYFEDTGQRIRRGSAALLDEQSGELTSGARKGPNPNATTALADAYAGGWKQTGGACEGSTGGASRYFTVLPDSEPRFLYTPKSSTAERNEGLDDLPEREGLGQQVAGAGGTAAIGNHNPTCDLCGCRKYGEPNKLSCNCDAPQWRAPRNNPTRNHHPTVKPLELMRWLVRLTKTPTGGAILDPFVGSGTTIVAALLEGRHCTGIEREKDYFEIARHRAEHWQDEASIEPRKIKGKDKDFDDMPLFAEVNS